MFQTIPSEKTESHILRVHPVFFGKTAVLKVDKKSSEIALILMLCVLFLTCLKYVTRLSLGLQDSMWPVIFCFLSEAVSGH